MAVNPRDRIIDMYRAEHRDLRDNLLALIEAFKARDKRKIRPLIKAVDEAGGPHMRCEEEAIYPALDKYYMDNQLGDPAFQRGDGEQRETDHVDKGGTVDQQMGRHVPGLWFFVLPG